MTTANAYGQCLLCQLERGGKSYARHNFALDSCDDHKRVLNKLLKVSGQVLNYIDDVVDLDANQPMRHDEQAEHDRIFNNIDKNR